MKGNEARVVLFLHPVKGFKEGQVSKAKPKSLIPRLRSILLILAMMFALGALAYALNKFINKQFAHLETTTEPLATTTTNPIYPTNTEPTMTTVDFTPIPGSKKTTQKHRNIIFLASSSLHNAGPDSEPFNIFTLYLYGVIASSSLLMTYLAVLYAFHVDLLGRVLETWKKAQGQPPGEEKQILHTLPYYLAITRSSCEVSTLQDSAFICWVICIFM